MCGRFGLWARLDAIEDHYDARFTFDYEPRYNIAPEDPAGIAAVKTDAPDEINRLQWGFVPRWVDDPEGWPAPINARAETVDETPAFRDAFVDRRCLIPASNFYEWTGSRGSRRPFLIGVEGRELFSMAGVWEPENADGQEATAAIITTASNDVVGELHDRMPVVLAPDEERTWLESADGDELRTLLDPYPDDETRIYEVSTAVNDPTNDAPELVEPLGSQQSGLGEFS